MPVRSRTSLIIGLVITSFVVVFLVYARFVEPYRISIERVNISSSKMKKGACPIRIAFFADTHSDPRPRLEPSIPAIVQNLSPDIIIFGGDALNSGDGVGHFRELMTKLVEIAPTFAVRGNWEVWRIRDARPYEGTGVKILDSEPTQIRVNDRVVWLAGFDVDKRAYPRDVDRKESFDLVEHMLSNIPKGGFVIFVHHFPEIAAHAAKNGADLALAADTHGGQVHLPLLGPLFRINHLDTYHDQGSHKIDPGLLYVNRGIGMIGSYYPRLRFNCPPEITLFVIESEED